MRHWPSTGPSRAIRYGGRQRLISEDLPCWGGAVRSRTGRRPAITSSTNWSTALQVSTENQLWRNRGRCTAETKAAKLVRAAMISASTGSTTGSGASGACPAVGACSSTGLAGFFIAPP